MVKINEEMKIYGEELFQLLIQELEKNHTLEDRYKVSRRILIELLQRVTENISIQFPDTYSRLVYVCETYHTPPYLSHNIQTLRKHIHLLMLKKIELTETDFQIDLWNLCEWMHTLTGAAIPTSLLAYKTESAHSVQEKADISEHYEFLRFVVLEVQEKSFSGKSEILGDDIHQVLYDAENSPFKESYQSIQAGQIIHLIDVRVQNLDIHAEMVILEPDYLLDISAIAECFKDYGHHHYNYLINKLSTKENSTPILIGSMANHFLDVFVNAPKEQVISFNRTMKDIFKMYPFEISVNAELDDEEKKRQFFDESRRQFAHIQFVVREVFPQQNIQVEKSVLEPSFICPQLGIQGRLDFLSLDKNHTNVIELKSGKAPFPYDKYDLVADNHKAQLFLYQIVIQKVLGIPFKNIHSYLLYSKYNDPRSNLRMVRPYMDGIKDILNMRNQIVMMERRIAEDVNYMPKIIEHLNPELIANKGNQNAKYLRDYIYPQILNFKSYFTQANTLELKYFYHFYQFVTKEHFISKSGVTHYDHSLGHAGVWLNDIEDKLEAGEILLDLKILENKTNESTPIIRLKIPTYQDDFLPNFRKGDIVILYQRDDVTDNVTNHQIYRGSIIEINHQEVVVRLRNSQNNTLFLPNDSLYAIEHDFMDSNFGSMYRGLYQFLKAPKDRRQLLLHQRDIIKDKSITLNTTPAIDDVKDILLKAKQAQDYFLLLGPPGTGKTSVALKSMVEEFYSDPECNILLLSYTNRAVDEICESISQISPEIDFIRIGSEFSTEAKFHHRLLQNVIKDLDKREQVKDALMRCRVFVGTVASISGKADLFRLKKFQVAIIDEASQILEPQILGILTMTHASNQCAIEKFIMIGDHKQLPAIVLQSPESSQVIDDDLNAIGLKNRNISLFERLFKYLQREGLNEHWAMLKKQGRMHPEIASFANAAFYENLLHVVPTSHQEADLDWNIQHESPLLKVLSTQRVAFFPSEKVSTDSSFKINSHEVEIITQLLKGIWHLYQIHGLEFKPLTSLGIITPYRSQIALIRKAIHELQIPELEEITIDTVERYQGSQRDIIIYSFCVNHSSQLRLLSNSFVENDKIIDRKLNVALTRAKKQMFLIGNPYYLNKDAVFAQMLQHYSSAATGIE